MEKAKKIEINITQDNFLKFSRRILNSCIYPQQAQNAYAFLIDRVNFLKFKQENKEHVREIIRFLFVARVEEIDEPVSSVWFD